MIHYTCPRCGESMESPNCLVGETEDCPRCAANVVVPAPPDEAPEAARPAPPASGEPEIPTPPAAPEPKAPAPPAAPEPGAPAPPTVEAPAPPVEQQADDEPEIDLGVFGEAPSAEDELDEEADAPTATAESQEATMPPPSPPQKPAGAMPPPSPVQTQPDWGILDHAKAAEGEVSEEDNADVAAYAIGPQEAEADEEDAEVSEERTQTPRAHGGSLDRGYTRPNGQEQPAQTSAYDLNR
ncbi:MAG: hypothetical protein KGY81_10540, partial [Phycisphaerae bacterium]|nr:hypothetical protein [Phycisphaerae bacterium]